MSAALYAHESDNRTTRSTERFTVKLRQDVRPDREARDEVEEKKFRELDRNKVIVRQRLVGKRVVWDVLKILNRRRTEAYALGCVWQEEAIALAQQCLSGRVFVSFHGVRALLKPDFRTPVRDVGPDRQVALTPRDGKPITESREIEVRPMAAK